MRTSCDKKIMSVFLLITGILLLYYLISKAGIARLIASLEYANYSYLVGGYSVAMLGMMVRAYKWHIALRTCLKAKLSFLQTSQIYFANATYSYFTPMKSGDLFAPYLLKKYFNVKQTKGFATIILDRLLEILTMFFLMIVGAIILLIRFHEKFEVLQNKIILSIALTAFIAIIAVGIARSRKTGMTLIKIILPGKIYELVHEYIETIYSNLSIIKSKITSLAVLTLIAWLLDSISFYFIVNAFLPINYCQAAAVEFIAAGIGIITMIPGGIGSSEVTIVFILNKMLGESICSTTVSLFVRAPFLIVILLGIIAFVWLSYNAKNYPSSQQKIFQETL